MNWAFFVRSAKVHRHSFKELHSFSFMAADSSLSLTLDVVGDNGDVLEVESSINLVHDVQRRRLKKEVEGKILCTEYLFLNSSYYTL